MKVNIVFYTLIIIFIIVATLVLIGISYAPSLNPPRFTGNVGNLNKYCTTTQVPCKNVGDCYTKCIEAGRGEEMQCVDMGLDSKICAPVTADIPDCNFDNGGVNVWSWDDTSRTMKWGCICSYPLYSNTPLCQQLNAGVCQGGTFTWDGQEMPTIDDCECGEGMVKMASDIGTPMCVPSNLEDWYTDTALSLE